jgi:hypothetical protein
MNSHGILELRPQIDAQLAPAALAFEPPARRTVASKLGDAPLHPIEPPSQPRFRFLKLAVQPAEPSAGDRGQDQKRKNRGAAARLIGTRVLSAGFAPGSGDGRIS